MQVSYINGTRLRSVLIAAGINLMGREEYLNDINVFPVPDGDTGTNMSGTMEEVLSVLVEAEDADLSFVSKMVAETAIMGAKGNSGTIVAQFFQGLANGLKNQAKVTTRFFAQAAKDAVVHTYKAVTNPREGTILTVLSEWADEMVYHSKSNSDFVDVHNAGLLRAHLALQKTTQQIPQLKDANVVDAGAQGFVDLLEGVSLFLKRGKLKEFYKSIIYDVRKKSRKRINASIVTSTTQLTYRYCCEFILKGKSILLEKLRCQLISKGDSLIVAGSDSLAKIHIHTDHPHEISKIVARYGAVEKSKVDDMQKQIHTAHQPHAECAIVIDSSCDIPIEEVESLGMHVVALSVQIGKDQFQDGETISFKQFYHLMHKNPNAVMKTSAPSIGQFLTKFNFLKSHYKSIIFISMSSLVSSTWQNALSASRILKEKEPDYPISIVDSKNGTVGIASIARSIAKLSEAGDSFAKISKKMNHYINSAKVYAVLPSLDRLLKGGRLSKSRVKILHFFRLRPILTNREGVIAKDGFYFQVKNGKHKIMKRIKKNIKKNHKYDWIIGHVENLKEALWLEKQIRIISHKNDDVLIAPVGPTMTCHSGPGALVVSFVERVN